MVSRRRCDNRRRQSMPQVSERRSAARVGSARAFAI
jgi:hypothetical protein